MRGWLRMADRPVAVVVALLLLTVACGGFAAPAARPPTTTTMPAPTPVPPTTTPTPTPTPAPTPDVQATVEALVQQRMAELQSPRQLQDRAAQAWEEARRVLRNAKGSDAIYLSEGLQEYLLPSAAYGLLLAPFLRPELTAEELENLTMAQFSGRELQSVPTVSQVARALLPAVSADPATLTGPQAELVTGLLRPESNGLVFQMATAPAVAQMGPIFGPIRATGLQRRFDALLPDTSFGQGIADGMYPWLNDFLPRSGIPSPPPVDPIAASNRRQAELAETADLVSAFGRQFRLQQADRSAQGQPVSSSFQQSIGPSATAGFLLAPFLYPQFADIPTGMGTDLPGLTMAEYLQAGQRAQGGGFGGPTLRMLGDALREALGGGEGLTETQRDISTYLLDPSQNELVFDLLTSGLRSKFGSLSAGQVRRSLQQNFDLFPRQLSFGRGVARGAPGTENFQMFLGLP